MGTWFFPAQLQTKPGLNPIPDNCSIMVPGQLVTEQIDLENGIVMSFFKLIPRFTPDAQWGWPHVSIQDSLTGVC
jgi:hypothetical protein